VFWRESQYDQGKELIEDSLFSNLSDLVRSGIRTGFKEIQQVVNRFDESY